MEANRNTEPSAGNKEICRFSLQAFGESPFSHSRMPLNGISECIGALAAGESLAIMPWELPLDIRLQLEAYLIDEPLVCLTSPEPSPTSDGRVVDRFNLWLRNLDEMLGDRGASETMRLNLRYRFDKLTEEYANATGCDRNSFDIKLYTVLPLRTHPGDPGRTERFHFDPGPTNGIRCISTLVGSEGTLFVRDCQYDRRLAVKLVYQEWELMRQWRAALKLGEPADDLLKAADEIQLRIHELVKESLVEPIRAGELGIFRIGHTFPLLHTSEPNPDRARLILKIDGGVAPLC